MRLAHQFSQRLAQGVMAPHFDIPVGSNDQDPAATELPRHECQQQERRRVCPVQVIEDDEQGLVVRGVPEEGGDGIEEAIPGDFWLDERRIGEIGEPPRMSGTTCAISTAPDPSSDRSCCGSRSWT